MPEDIIDAKPLRVEVEQQIMVAPEEGFADVSFQKKIFELLHNSKKSWRSPASLATHLKCDVDQLIKYLNSKCLNLVEGKIINENLTEDENKPFLARKTDKDVYYISVKRCMEDRKKKEEHEVKEAKAKKRFQIISKSASESERYALAQLVLVENTLLGILQKNHSTIAIRSEDASNKLVRALKQLRSANAIFSVETNADVKKLRD